MEMEYQLSSFSVILVITFLFISVLRMMKKKYNLSSSTLKDLPPGPWKLPLIGNMHLLVGSVPHRRLRDLATKYGPVMHLKLGEVSNIVISSPEAAKEMMKDNDTCFLQRPHLLVVPFISFNHSDIAFCPHGDYWRRVRKICVMELLSMKRVQSYRSIREEAVSKLVASITVSSSSSSGSPINFTKTAFSLLNDMTAQAAFGSWRCKDQEAFKQVTKRIIELAAGFNLVDMFPSVKFLEVLSGTRFELERLQKEVDMIAENIINDHRASRTTMKENLDQEDDLVHVLLNLEGENLTMDNIKGIILDLFLAGSESSSTLIDWTMSEMLKNPRVLEKAQTEIRKICHSKGKNTIDETDLHELQYLKLVIKEALRLHAPLILITRESTKACKILGYDIPVGSRILVNTWAIGLNPSYWVEADRFYPERFADSSVDYKGNNFELIPFGAGRRMCPGLLFGMANVELPLAQLLYHFDWELPDGVKNQDLDMTERFGLTVTRKNDLYLIPIPYHSI